MLDLVIKSDYSLFFVLIVTTILIAEDRFFTKKTRQKFYCAIGCMFVVVAFLHVFGGMLHENYEKAMAGTAFLKIARATALYLLYLLIMGNKQNLFRKFCFFSYLLFCVIAAVSTMTEWMFFYEPGVGAEKTLFGTIFEGIMLAGLTITATIELKDNDRIHENRKSIAMYVLTPCIVLVTVAFTVMGYDEVFDRGIGSCICLYYFYLAGQTYKKDQLTNLLNRYQLNYDMDARIDKKYEVALIDVDNFKLINDEYGHERGDEVLKECADIIRHNVPKGSVLYRYGGDEFVLLGGKITREEMVDLFEGIGEMLAEKKLSVTSGFATHVPGMDADTVITEADTQMYIRKRRKKSDDIFDLMTGLYNTRGFLDELDIMKKKAMVERKDIGIISLDIEHLDNINSVYGCLEGNLIIVNLVKLLRESLPERALAGNLGGDEFAVAILVPEGDEECLKNIAIELTEKLERELNIAEKDYSVDLAYAFGLVCVMPDTVMENAVEDVLYQKRSNRENRQKAQHASTEISSEEEALVETIFSENRFRYAFQPIVSTATGDIVGYEALMRSDTEPMIPPLTILKYAEEHGRMYEIEYRTYFNVLKYVKDNLEKFGDKNIFINTVPGHELTDSDIEELVSLYGDIIKRTVVEITEQKELEDSEIQIIEERRSRFGYTLAIDDFGSGCSNTNSLLRYSPQIIKLDRMLISGIDQNSKKQYFVNSIITFAKQNDMKVLAEGVETEAELRTVIKLQADYIQGFFTAKPRFDILTEIDEDIRNIILEENIRKNSASDSRKIYVTGGNEFELSLVHLALEEYSGLTIAQPEIRLVGGYDFAADMCIKIKDGLSCKLYLSDIKVNSVDDLPCIELGEYSNLTIYLEGSNVLNQRGIYVPETANLTVKGSGSLKIMVKGHSVCAIGSNPGHAVGGIEFAHSGVVEIKADGDKIVGIGGGKYTGGLGICLDGGKINLDISAVDSVGIGCFEGDIPISGSDFVIDSVFKVNSGVVIGSLNGVSNISLAHFLINISGNGSTLTCIGGYNETNGRIAFNSGEITLKGNGQDVVLVGARSGELDINILHVTVDVRGEGNKVLAFGTWDKKSALFFGSTHATITINSAEACAYGIAEDKLVLENPAPELHVNE